MRPGKVVEAPLPGHGDDASTTSTTSGYREEATTDSTAAWAHSAAVSWWSVNEWVSPLLENMDRWPMVGTPEWCALPDRHPAKTAAIYDAARHWALRVEAAQEAAAQASQAISGAVDWAALAGRIRRGRGAYIPRKAHHD